MDTALEDALIWKNTKSDTERIDLIINFPHELSKEIKNMYKELILTSFSCRFYTDIKAAKTTAAEEYGKLKNLLEKRCKSYNEFLRCYAKKNKEILSKETEEAKKYLKASLTMLNINENITKEVNFSKNTYEEKLKYIECLWFLPSIFKKYNNTTYDMQFEIYEHLLEELEKQKWKYLVWIILLSFILCFHITIHL